MRKRSTTLIAAALLGASAGTAHAAPTLRVQVDQHGDFLLIGNTLGIECAAGTPAPVVGTIGNGACNQGNNVNDTSPDLFWRADSPTLGAATADLTIAPAQARSTAVLTIPAGATVTHAFLYWGANNSVNAVDTSVTIERPGMGSPTTVNALQSFKVTVGAGFPYQSVADVTAVVQQLGSGAYRVSGIDSADFRNVNDSGVFAGWSMVVLYQRATDPLRNLAIFDGLDVVTNGSNQNVTLSGFLVPNAGFNGKLGVIAYEGDNLLTGDQLLFNNVVLTDAQNPANNFFNGTRSNLGLPVSNVGDLPQLTGTAQSMGSLDLDVVDITAQLSPGQTSAPVQATSMGDTYYLGAFITSVSTFKPDFSTSQKTATDVNGGALLPGDVLQYTINVTNTGNDASKNTVLTDPLPVGITYVPGSIQIAGAGKTDMAGDDQAEYIAGTRTLVARLGVGATATQGGTIAIGGMVTVTFKATVDAGASGSIANQAIINAGGQLGAPAANTPTDGNGPAGGSPPTTVVIDQCATNADCMAPTPICDTTPSPKVCVQCLADNDCGGAMSGKVCDATSKTCVDGCRGTGGNGCPTTAHCTSMDASIGQCVECVADGDCGGAMSGKVCDTTTDKCVDGCRGMGGNGCPMGDECTSMDASIGSCVQCLTDSDCGGPMSGKICDTTTDTCVPGCKGMGGNGCPTGQSCTSVDTSAGQCVECLKDSDCGGPGTGKVCDLTTDKCVDGCRGTNEGDCPAGQTCTSMDATIGMCVECLKDPDCGGPMSGKVCDATAGKCVDGCRGMDGNGCPTGDTCTSTDATIGQCVVCLSDSDCGDATSGKVCDASGMCVDGCRGTGGNGCPGGGKCTSMDMSVGQCVQCVADGDCGGATSGKICDVTSRTCVPGCRGTGGNGCPDGETCTSSDGSAGMCSNGGTGGTGGTSPSGIVAEGNGIFCAATPGTGSDGSGWLFGTALAALLGLRRRKRG